MKGKLYLVPAPLDFGCDAQTAITSVLPNGTLEAASRIRYWICENAKSTRAVLKRVAEHYPLACPLIEMTITELPREAHKKGDHTTTSDQTASQAMLDKALQGFDIGLMSEAGMPAIADPGSSIVRAAHARGIEVVPLVGPISLMLALAASGLNGQNFAFNGYLPQDPAARKARIHQLEKHALHSAQTQIFIETPYRNIALLNDLIATLQPTSRLACSIGLTLDGTQTLSFLIQDWHAKKALANALLANKLPAIFSFGASC
ncbi:MAG: SAM-dependent methyltransferase [Cytophagales bacterium]|nr:SAM-dependent methyltransferase [Cytophagales bacterium]